ncbi:MULTISPECIES: PqqD family peptide modification chaperone [unclassified Terrabacter]|uniref:PqqD family peptide modification chaperone n=1 Tax=unclassified Terrabacter TaxID=2630222 RepID=UPI0012FA8CE4|nr:MULTISPECIES: PqqD family peptide modification chaperone [unclassified Terrabacter]
MSDDGQCVYVAHLPGGPIVVLEGAAALIWVEATTEPATGWVARVAEAFGQSEEVIAADVAAFVADLGARDLLVTAPTEAPGTPG